MATIFVCFSRLWQTVWTQYMSSLFWVHAVSFYTEFVSNARQLFAADGFSLRLNMFWLLKRTGIIFLDSWFNKQNHRFCNNLTLFCKKIEICYNYS